VLQKSKSIYLKIKKRPIRRRVILMDKRS